jgi:hypothetical protein
VKTGFLFHLPVGVFVVALLAAMFGSLVLGRRLGASDGPTCDEDARTHAGGLQAAMLGLLALMLGFTFSMTAQRFETNRDLVVLEANSIETAYLRAEIAAAPEREALEESLRRYVATSVAFFDEGTSAERRAALAAESLDLHARMWSQAAASAAKAPTSTMALLVDSVNQVIDAYRKRVDAARHHVPSVILWLLVLMAVASTGLTGYVSGFGNRRHGAPTAVVLTLIALVIGVIVDLDRPVRGMIRGGHESMVELQATLQAHPPQAAR